jgi:hypothetical protein
MREFFRGWRRKAGCVALLMACVFAAAWVRSVYFIDAIGGRPSATSIIVLMSVKNRMQVKFRAWQPYFPQPVGLRKIFWDCDKSDNKTIASLSPESIWNSYGPVFDAVQHGPGNRAHILVVPYWNIVFPLTVVSAYLLLRKPRPPESP